MRVARLAWFAAAGALETMPAPVYDLAESTSRGGWPVAVPSYSQSREDAAIFFTYFARSPGYRGTYVEIGARPREAVASRGLQVASMPRLARSRRRHAAFQSRRRRGLLVASTPRLSSRVVAVACRSPRRRGVRSI